MKTFDTLFKVAGNSFQYFQTLRVWWVIITTLYWLMLQSWYQQTARLSVNELLFIVWHNRLPLQQYDLLKTPLILALSAYNSKMSSVTPIFCYRIIISMIRCNFLQSLKKFCKESSEPPLSYKRLKLKLRVLLAGHIVAMVTYCATQLTATHSLMIGQFVDTMILASTDKERL